MNLLIVMYMFLSFTLFIGPYQPSYDMMLKFYSYFKQATEGPCKTRRPAFWDMVGKVKYDAWKRLGDMPKEKAMEGYVGELRQIVETMSYTQNVAEFYNSLSEFEMKVEDIELIAPEVIRSKSQENSPHHKTENEIAVREEISNGHTNNTQEESSDEEYIDTVDVSKQNNSSENDNKFIETLLGGNYTSFVRASTRQKLCTS